MFYHFPACCTQRQGGFRQFCRECPKDLDLYIQDKGNDHHSQHDTPGDKGIPCCLNVKVGSDHIGYKRNNNKDTPNTIDHRRDSRQDVNYRLHDLCEPLTGILGKIYSGKETDRTGYKDSEEGYGYGAEDKGQETEFAPERIPGRSK